MQTGWEKRADSVEKWSRSEGVAAGDGAQPPDSSEEGSQGPWDDVVNSRPSAAAAPAASLHSTYEPLSRSSAPFRLLNLCLKIRGLRERLVFLGVFQVQGYRNKPISDVNQLLQNLLMQSGCSDGSLSILDFFCFSATPVSYKPGDCSSFCDISELSLLLNIQQWFKNASVQLNQWNM